MNTVTIRGTSPNWASRVKKRKLCFSKLTLKRWKPLRHQKKNGLWSKIRFSPALAMLSASPCRPGDKFCPHFRLLRPSLPPPPKWSEGSEHGALSSLPVSPPVEMEMTVQPAHCSGTLRQPFCFPFPYTTFLHITFHLVAECVLICWFLCILLH